MGCSSAWAHGLPATGTFGFPYSSGMAVGAVDATGDIIVTGNFVGTLDLGGITLTDPAPSNGSVFIAKLDCTGSAIWANNYPNADTKAKGIAGLSVDPTGGIVVTGTFQGTLDFGSGTFTSSNDGTLSAYVAKWDASGNPLWTQSYDGGGGSGIVTDTAGDVYFTSGMDTTIDFGGGSIGPGVAVVKLDPTGAYLWSQALGAGGLKIAIDSGGDIVLTGEAFATNWIDEPLSGLPGATYVALGKLDPSGTPVWSKAFGNAGGTPTLPSWQMAMDPAGDIFLTGELANGNGIDFGGGPVSVPNTTETFFVGFTPDGANVFTKMLGDSTYVGPSALAASSGDVFLLGGFGPLSIDFGGGPVMATSPDTNGTVFVARYATSGSFVSVDTYGSSMGQDDGVSLHTNTLAIDPSGMPIIAGDYQGTFTFGATPLPASPKSYAALIAKLAP